MKAIDMRYWWLRDHDNQEQFRYYWRPSPTNCGDYFTKHHRTAHHQEKRLEYLTPRIIPQALRASTTDTLPLLAKASWQHQQPDISCTLFL